MTSLRCLLLVSCVVGANTSPTIQLMSPPVDALEQPEWLSRLRSWAEEVRKNVSYAGGPYEDPAVNWTRLSYVQPQTHLYDRYLYDPERHEYTVDRYLKDVEDRYGGIDSILLWPTYTNIGIDDRNQFDYFRALPGGLDGLRSLTAQFKARGVRVLWAYNPWDNGTRSEGEPHWDTLARLLKQTGGDGFNGDTMTTMYRQFWAAGVAIDHHIVGEMEGGGYPDPQQPHDTTWQSINWDPMGWGEYWHNGTKADNITYDYPVAPGVDPLKLLDSRHMVHVCDRWAKNRTDPMQYAFFNGVGYESWENVWGMFMKFTERDGEALKRVATLLRWLGRELFIQDYASWEPYSPDLVRNDLMPYAAGGVIASKFVRRDGACAWLLVNRASAAERAKVDVSTCLMSGRRAAFDVYHGVPVDLQGQYALVDIEANGYGAVIVSTHSESLGHLLTRMRSLTQMPLASYSVAWAPQQQTMVGHTSSGTSTSEEPPKGMVLIPKTSFRFRTAGVEIEGGCEPWRDSWGVCCGDRDQRCPGPESCATPCAFNGDDSRGIDAQFPWENTPGRFHDRLLELGPFYIDRHLVTRQEYAAFLSSSKYSPRDTHNFLPGWSRGKDGYLQPPRGTEQWPVTSLSLGEARGYCAWAGKRLPHTYEWQLAAQGTDGRLYPWGNTLADGAGKLFPRPSNATTVPPLPDVGSFSPQGDSVYGMADVVGFVWQYTDEFRDEHTRTVLLKGSSLYTPMLSGDFPAMPQVGNWYFPKAVELDRHNRMMLMDDSYERASTLGFRCVADHAQGQAGPYHFRDMGPGTSWKETSELDNVDSFIVYS